MNRFLHPQFWVENPGNRPWKSRLQVVVVVVVLGVSAFVAATGSQDRLMQILMLVASLIGLVVLLQWPALGLLGVLFGSFFVRFTGPGGLNTAVLGVAGVSALWIADMFIRQRKFYTVEPRTTRAILVFIGSAALSYLVGQLPWQPLARQAPITAQTGGLLIFVLSGFAFLAIGNIVRDLRWLKAFTWMFVAIGALYIVARLLPPVAEIMRRYFQAGATTGSLFWVWLLVIPFSQALINKNLGKFWRAALMALVVAVLYVSMVRANDWKSGFIPPLVGAAVIVALALGKRVVWFIPVLLVVGWLVISQAITSDQYSTITRLEAWKIVLQLSSVSPLFGLGFGNYYWYTPLVPILGWHVSFNSHSQYVDILAQTGLIGMACFLWVFWEIGRLGWRLRARAPEGFAKAYVYGALGGLAGTLAAGFFVDWILPFVYNIGMSGFRASVFSWLFLGGLVAIHQSITQQQISEITD